MSNPIWKASEWKLVVLNKLQKRLAKGCSRITVQPLTFSRFCCLECGIYIIRIVWSTWPLCLFNTGVNMLLFFLWKILNKMTSNDLNVRFPSRLRLGNLAVIPSAQRASSVANQSLFENSFCRALNCGIQCLTIWMSSKTVSISQIGSPSSFCPSLISHQSGDIVHQIKTICCAGRTIKELCGVQMIWYPCQVLTKLKITHIGRYVHLPYIRYSPVVWKKVHSKLTTKRLSHSHFMLVALHL